MRHVILSNITVCYNKMIKIRRSEIYIIVRCAGSHLKKLT